MNNIFKNIYDVKRLQPGKKKYSDTDNLYAQLLYIRGNSGSPVINVLTGKAIGLHFGGRYLRSNYAVQDQYLIHKFKKRLN